MFSVLSAAQDVSTRSGGAFDITVGPLVRLWGFHDKKPHVPTTAELAAVRPLVDYRNLVLDREHRTVYFVRPGVELDLGGIAKGFAVEIAAGRAAATRRGWFHRRRRESVSPLDTPPGKRLWSVGVKDPRPSPTRARRDRHRRNLSLDLGRLRELRLTENGRTYGHILDPHTLAPSDRALSVTILSRDGTLADALSKAVFVLGPKAGLALVESFPGASALIAYRDRDGGVATMMPASLKSRFHPSVNQR